MDNVLVPCEKCSTLNELAPYERRRIDRPACIICGSSLPIHGNVAEVRGEGLQNLLYATPKSVVIDFSAGWCRPCKTFRPIFEDASLRLGNTFHFLEVDVENDPYSGALFEVRNIPALVALKDSVETLRQLGVMSLKAFLQWLETVKSYESQRSHGP